MFKTKIEWTTYNKVSDGKGYILVLCPEHLHKKHGNYVYEHRLIMEQKLGRYLTSEESVHHLNGDRSDNRLENLKLFANDAEHAKFEKRGCSNTGEALVAYAKGHKKPRFEVTCACGCGTTIITPDGRGRPRLYAQGHNQINKHWKWKHAQDQD